MGHDERYIVPAAKNCNGVLTNDTAAWPRSHALGVLLAMTARNAKSALGGWGLPLLLVFSGCSGGVASDEHEAPGEQPTIGSGSDEQTVPTAVASGDAPTTNVVDGVDSGNGSDAEPSTSPTTNTPPPANPAIAPTHFECDPTAIPPAAPLRRLTRKQYENSIRDALTQLLGSEVGTDPELAALLEGVPGEERLKLPEDLHGSYRRLDQRVQQPLVDAWFTAGVNVGKWLASQARLPALVGDCSEYAGSTECIHAFIDRWGRVLLRRPLTVEDVDLFYGFYAPSTGVDAAGVADVIAGLLNAPDFLYLVEGRAEASGDAAPEELTPHELAARLSYHFWNTLPDPELAALADSGELHEPATYRAQVERLFADPRSRDALHDFYAEWLKLEDLSALDRNNDSPLFQAFAGEQLPSSELAGAMRDEVLNLLEHYTFVQPGGVTEILNTPSSFATSGELAGLYGVEPWDERAAPPSLGRERPGVFTRAAFLATGTANSRPIMRGLFLRTNVLCDTIAPPPAAAGATPPELSPEATTRQVVEELTSPDACYGCHNTFINPLGFAFEGFDSLGRVRTEQRLFDEVGQELGARPIDTRSIPQVVLGDTTSSSGPEDLMRLMAESGKVEACLARQYFRYTFGRWEQVAADGCALEQLRESLVTHGNLSTMLRDVALASAFRRRSGPVLEAGEQ